MPIRELIQEAARQSSGIIEPMPATPTFAGSERAEPFIGLHFGPEWFWDQNRPGAIEARRQMAEFHMR